MCSDQDREDSWIPIIIPAQNWDPRASNLDYWVVRQTSSLLDIEKAIAWSLLEADIILPIFDGLDEMDLVPDEPSNASEFVKVLNSWNRKFMVTCRTDTWNFLESTGYILEDACNVRLEPLTFRQVTDYLELRNRPNAQGTTTRSIVKKLSRNPSSTLSTPFDLALLGSLLKP
jgi:predicted NACHT family NTPase